VKTEEVKERIRKLIGSGTFKDDHLDSLRLTMALLEMVDDGMSVREFRSALAYGKSLLEERHVNP
jgi:hypothetical protein